MHFVRWASVDGESDDEVEQARRPMRKGTPWHSIFLFDGALLQQSATEPDVHSQVVEVVGERDVACYVHEGRPWHFSPDEEAVVDNHVHFAPESDAEA
jgi:hypothetical protein